MEETVGSIQKVGVNSLAAARAPHRTTPPPATTFWVSQPLAFGGTPACKV